MGTVQSVDRALLLLAAVGRSPAGLVDLAGRADLATSTAARLLATLEAAGAVSRSADGTYRIGPLVQAMSSSSGAPTEAAPSLEVLAHPSLVTLSEALDEAACLAMVSGDDTVTVDQVDAPKPVQAENWTGTRVPMHAGGAGVVAMATWDGAEVERYLGGELAVYSTKTVTDRDRLRSRIRQARVRRVMWTHGEYVDGLSSCSAAIVDRVGRALAVVYVYGPSYRFPGDGEADRIASLVLQSADELSMELGWSGPVREAS